MSFTTDNRFVGTELMVRKLLADRLYLTKEQRKPKDPKLKINWLVGMAVVIRLVVDKTIQAKQPKGLKIREGKTVKVLQKSGDVVTTKDKGHAFSVEIKLVNIRHKNDENDMLNLDVQLINNNGALTKWHMSDAINWFKRAMPKVGYSAVIEVWDGENLSNEWGASRKSKLDREFFLVSASQMNADAAVLEEKALAMAKYNLQRAAMYKYWGKNLLAGARFYDEVRTA